MAILHVRNIPDELYERIKKRAHSEKRSLSAEILTLLERGLNEDRRTPGPRQRSIAKILEENRRDRESWRLPEGAPDSVQLIRESRGPLE